MLRYGWEILTDALAQTPHIITNGIWLVMDHVRTGEWASVLPRPVRVMISGDKELETFPLPKTGTAPSMGIVLPGRKPASPVAEAFFEIGTSREVLEKVHEFLGHDPSRDTPAVSRAARLRDAKASARKHVKKEHRPSPSIVTNSRY